MQDVPPEISVALAVVQSLTASGRCREDHALYASATALVKQYLDSSLRPAVASATSPFAPPQPVWVSPPAAVVVPLAAQPAPPATPAQPIPIPTPTTITPPRPDAVWNERVGVFVIPRPGATHLPIPPTPPPRPSAVWHDGTGQWLIDRTAVG